MENPIYISTVNKKCAFQARSECVLNDSNTLDATMLNCKMIFETPTKFALNGIPVPVLIVDMRMKSLLYVMAQADATEMAEPGDSLTTPKRRTKEICPTNLISPKQATKTSQVSLESQLADRQSKYKYTSVHRSRTGNGSAKL